MRLPDDSSEVLLSRTNDNSIQLACAGCGKIGVSICAKCAKTGYRKAVARANPLAKRDPELYRRLDQLSRLSLKKNRKLWDEFCIEINAGDYYEHLLILVEILHEGKWRTNVLKVKEWLRETLVRRAKRSASGSLEDYDSTGKRLAARPKFDKRNGALTGFATRPFTEFAVLCEDGDTIDPDEEAIEGQLERKRLQTASEDDDYRTVVLPADRESKRILGGSTLAEWVEQGRCVLHLELLQRNRPVFDSFLAQTISEQQVLCKGVGLDHDESEALAVITLLWATGPRAYLNYLDPGNKRRLRNAFDRLNRKLQNSDWAMVLRKTLKEQARNKRYFYREESPAPLRTSNTSRPRVGTREVGSRGAYGLPAELTLRWHTRDDHAKGLLFPPSKETLPDTDAEEVVRLVDLGCDLTPQQRALYRSFSRKPKPRRKTKLYSE